MESEFGREEGDCELWRSNVPDLFSWNTTIAAAELLQAKHCNDPVRISALNQRHSSWSPSFRACLTLSPLTILHAL